MSWGTGGASGTAAGAGQSTAAMGSATGVSSSLGYGAGTGAAATGAGAAGAGSGLSAAGAGAAGAGASSIPQGTGASLPGQMADISGKGSYQGSSGFSAGLETTPTQGPTVANAASLPSYSSNMVKGKLATMVDRFSAGGKQSIGDTIKGFGNNPETYGALYKYLSSIASMGGGKSAAPVPIPINNVYQKQPNDYLKKYYGR